jgi:hypothetical protein
MALLHCNAQLIFLFNYKFAYVYTCTIAKYDTTHKICSKKELKDVCLHPTNRTFAILSASIECTLN